MKIDNFSQLQGNVVGLPLAWVHSREEQIDYSDKYNKYVSTQYLLGGNTGGYSNYRQALMSYGYDKFENDYSDYEKEQFLFKHNYPPISVLDEI